MNLLFLVLKLFIGCNPNVDFQSLVGGEVSVEKDSIQVLSGFVFERETGNPVRNEPLEIRYRTQKSGIQQKVYLKTDVDGFYFWKNLDQTIWIESYYSIGIKGVVYSQTLEDEGESIRQSSLVNFINKRVFKSSRSRITFIRKTRNSSYEVRLQRNPTELEDSVWVRSSLQKLTPDFRKENELIESFKRNYSAPVKTITKYRNGYFDQQRNLLAYEGKVSLFLDGEICPDSIVSSMFSNREPAVMKIIKGADDLAKEIWLYCSELDSAIPPLELIDPANYEWIDLQNFDIKVLKKEPYYLDGYWQVKGMGENRFPNKAEIKRVALFKGSLAKHYNWRFEKLWWIETKTPEQVWARPEFEGR